MTMTDLAVERLAKMAGALRPDWQYSSLKTLIRGIEGHTPAEVAHALVWIALDSGTKSPGRVRENGIWWKILPDAGTAPDTRPRCAVPGHEIQPAPTCQPCSSLLKAGQPLHPASRIDAAPDDYPRADHPTLDTPTAWCVDCWTTRHDTQPWRVPDPEPAACCQCGTTTTDGIYAEPEGEPTP